MSEIRVTTLKDTSGNNSSSTADIFSGRAKAWVNFNGEGTVAIRASFNVNSITDNGGTGNYTVNFSNALSDANYASCVAAGTNASGLRIATAPAAGVAPTTSALRILTSVPGADVDVTFVNVAIFR